MMRVTRGAVISCDILLLGALFRQGLIMPSPPRRTGNAIRFMSASFKAFWPVSDGRNLCLIAFSSGCSNSSREEGTVALHNVNAIT